MQWIKKIALKLFGKKIIEDGIEKTGMSKTKVAALIFVLITGVETVSTAWGHPVIVPDYLKEFLAGVGLWTLRDALR